MRYFRGSMNQYTNSDLHTFREELRAFHDKIHSWRLVGETIGRSGTYALRVCRGDLNPVTECLTNWHYFKSGERTILAEVPICPDCGDPHFLGRCHGKPGDLAMIAPDERVYHKRAPHQVNDLFDMSQAALRRAILNRKPY